MGCRIPRETLTVRRPRGRLRGPGSTRRSAAPPPSGSLSLNGLDRWRGRSASLKAGPVGTPPSKMGSLRQGTPHQPRGVLFGCDKRDSRGSLKRRQLAAPQRVVLLHILKNTPPAIGVSISYQSCKRLAIRVLDQRFVGFARRRP